MATVQRAVAISKGSDGGTSDDDSIASSSESNTSSLIDPSRQFQESLKYEQEEEIKKAGSSDDDDDDDEEDDRRPSVQFDTTVSGVEIPLHCDYPESTRRRMWMSFEEIHKNAERNINEFRADNWEWRNAVEEDGMLLQENMGVLVHPASYKRPKTKRKVNKKKKRRKHALRQHCAS